MARLNGAAGVEAEVDIEIVGDEAVVTLSGEIDLSNADELARLLAPLIDGAAAGTVVVDASGLVFIDSSGIAVLIRMAKAGRTVRIRRPSPVVRQVVVATGLAGVLHLEP